MKETIKAKEIIDLYRNSSGCYEDQVTNALIHVNSIIKNVGMFDVSSVNDYLDYWEKVKQEIEQTKIQLWRN